MKLRLITAIASTLLFENVYSQQNNLDESEIRSVKKVISLFKELNPDKISEIIKYPLNREHPIPPIKNKTELKQRFYEIFDKNLISKIAQSELDQWTEVGWRGIMLDNGIIWLGNSDETITSINYQSNYEKRLKEQLISKDKIALYNTLKNYKKPIYQIKTETYLIRIDELSNGFYRYASWKRTSNQSSKPDIILNNGRLQFEGSGGNHVITFIKGEYQYKIYRNHIGESETPEVSLTVEKNNRIILNQDGNLLSQ